MIAPVSSTFEISVSASLPNRFLPRTAAPVFEWSLPSKRCAKASCSTSVKVWPRKAPRRDAAGADHDRRHDAQAIEKAHEDDGEHVPAPHHRLHARGARGEP